MLPRSEPIDPSAGWSRRPASAYRDRGRADPPGPLLELIDARRRGTLHASDSGTASWLELAEAILETAGLGLVIGVPDGYPSHGRSAEERVMQLDETPIPEVKVFTPRRFEDARGFLSETYSRAKLRETGIDTDFVQDNHSFSASEGTIRGLHYQEPPRAQAKLVRVVRGAVLDVAVDLRTGSPTYGRWTAVVVSASRWNQVYVPIGFAHGFCTLEPDTHVLYKLSSEYAPESERGIRWDDPDLAIEWPHMDHYVLSDRDREWPAFVELESPFDVGGAPAHDGLRS